MNPKISLRKTWGTPLHFSRGWGHDTQNEVFARSPRERAVRMVFERGGEYASEWAALQSIAAKIGCSAETLRNWVRRTPVDTGSREGVTSEERARVKEPRCSSWPCCWSREAPRHGERLRAVSRHRPTQFAPSS
jgi:transposase-like protein